MSFVEENVGSAQAVLHDTSGFEEIEQEGEKVPDTKTGNRFKDDGKLSEGSQLGW